MVHAPRKGRGAWFAGFFALAWLAACGDDATAGSGGASGTGAVSGGEQCVQPGGTETGCACEGTPAGGHRTCSADYVWSACKCPPREAACRQGDMAACMCPGESEPRMTICLAGGTFDCPCPWPLDDADSGTDGG